MVMVMGYCGCARTLGGRARLLVRPRGRRLRRGDSTQELLLKVRTFVQTMQSQGVHTIVGGDWNLTPTQLQRHDWLHQAGLTAVYDDLTEPTCRRTGRGTPRLLDFFAISKALGPSCLGVRIRKEFVATPHWPVQLLIQQEWAE